MTNSKLSRQIIGLIGRLGQVVPYSQSTAAAVRDPADPDQRKLEAKRARRAQIKRQNGRP